MRSRGARFQAPPGNALSSRFRLDAASALRGELPPGPELDPEIAREPAGDQLSDRALPAVDLGVAGHLGFQLQPGVIETGAHEDRLVPPLLALLLRYRRGDGGHRSLEALLRKG